MGRAANPATDRRLHQRAARLFRHGARFAEETRRMLSRLQGDFTPLGELRSIKFRGPFMMGGDEFEIAFANGTRLMAIVLDPNGKIVAASPPMMVRPES